MKKIYADNFLDHLELSKSAAKKGMVLLKNDNQLLPLNCRKLALFGSGAIDTIYTGTGSGYVFYPMEVNICTGLEKAGFELTSQTWLERYQKEFDKANESAEGISELDKVWGGVKIHIDDLSISEEEMAEAKKADIAVYVIRRVAGEGKDRKNEKGDFILSDSELDNLIYVSSEFSHCIVILNTCMMDLAFLDKIPGIDAVLLLGLGGCCAGAALAEVLSGNGAPGGRLSDTWGMNYSDYPASKTYLPADQSALQEDYVDDIYVGYRYFDSFDIEPRFPFGYGLSYTTFERRLIDISVSGDGICIAYKVKNTGKYAGSDVMQIYVTPPPGALKKAYQVLTGFGTSHELEPDQEEDISVHVPISALSSFNEKTHEFELEAGTYIIRCGSHSRSTQTLCRIMIEGRISVLKSEYTMDPDHLLETFSSPEVLRNYPEHGEIILNKVRQFKLNPDDTIGSQKIDKHSERKLIKDEDSVDSSKATLIDVKSGKVSLEDFIDSLDEQVLFRLVSGYDYHTDYEVESRLEGMPVKNEMLWGSGMTTSQFLETLGIPQIQFADGPAGLHIDEEEPATCWPSAVVLAQTWDVEMLEKIGKALGKEMKLYKNSGILGPGMNIHREPLCGRNFEYFSEDPYLTGKMAAALIRGIQSEPGCMACPKHFACNNRETNRDVINVTLSEQALREIYLKAFEIVVNESAPKLLMTSYNHINGIHTSSNPTLLNGILRREWGFDGLVMTDWGSKSDKIEDLKAGNDLIMPGYHASFFEAACYGTDPLFSEDGYVKRESCPILGGFFTSEIEHWNSFEPDAGGSDTVETIVTQGKAISEKVYELEKEGVTRIIIQEDGSRKIVYKGNRKGITLSVTDIKKNVYAVLKTILESFEFAEMYDQYTNNENE